MGCLAWHAKAWCPTFLNLLGSTDTMCKSSCTFALTQTSHLSCNGTTANFPNVDCNGTMCIWLVLLVTSAIPATMIITFTIAHNKYLLKEPAQRGGFHYDEMLYLSIMHVAISYHFVVPSCCLCLERISWIPSYTRWKKDTISHCPTVAKSKHTLFLSNAHYMYNMLQQHKCCPWSLPLWIVLSTPSFSLRGLTDICRSFL